MSEFYSKKYKRLFFTSGDSNKIHCPNLEDSKCMGIDCPVFIVKESFEYYDHYYEVEKLNLNIFQSIRYFFSTIVLGEYYHSICAKERKLAINDAKNFIDENKKFPLAWKYDETNYKFMNNKQFIKVCCYREIPLIQRRGICGLGQPIE